MASTSASMEINVEQPQEVDGQFIRVIVADTQAIFRAGLRKIFALEDNIRVVGQSETLVPDGFRRQEIYRRHSDLRSCSGAESRGCRFRSDPADSRPATGGGDAGARPGNDARTATPGRAWNCFARSGA